MYHSIGNKLSNLLNSLFNKTETQTNKLLEKILILILYLFGVVLWIRFLDFGKIPKNRLDWGDITFPRLAVIQQAIQKGEIPLYVSEEEGLKGVTNLFLSVPDQILSPDIILLQFLSIENFIVVHLLLFYSLGFWGLILFKKKHMISFVAFIPLFLLFNFNGHIVSHLAVGHLTWASYFLFSFYFLLIFEILDGQSLGWKWIGKLSILQFFIFLSGGYHQFVWVLFLLGILFLINKNNRLVIFGSMIFSILINSFRILPAALLSKDLDIGFMAGFPTSDKMLEGLVKMLTPLDAYFPQLQKVDVLVWEQNFYLGLVGFVFMILFGIVLMRGNRNFELFIVPSLMLVLLSTGNIYKILFDTGIPLLSGERISTRFLIMAILYFLFFGTIQFQKYLHYLDDGFKKIVLIIGILLSANDLSQHLAHWSIQNIFEVFPNEVINNNLSLGVGNNSTYAILLVAGLLISILVILFFSIKILKSTK